MRPLKNVFRPNVVLIPSFCFFLHAAVFTLCYCNPSWANAANLPAFYWLAALAATLAAADAVNEFLFVDKIVVRDRLGILLTLLSAVVNISAIRAYFKLYTDTGATLLVPRYGAAALLFLLTLAALFLKWVRMGKSDYFVKDKQPKYVPGMVFMVALASLVFSCYSAAIDATKLKDSFPADRVFSLVLLAGGLFVFLYALYLLSTTKVDFEDGLKNLEFMCLAAFGVALVTIFVIVGVKSDVGMESQIFYWELFPSVGSALLYLLCGGYLVYLRQQI